MPQEYSWEIRERAEELYVVDGLTYEQVAKTTGVAASTLKRWADEGQWGARKKEYRQALTSIERNAVLLRKGLIEKALSSLDPQDVYAVARLEAVMNRRKTGEPAALPAPETRDIKTPQDAVETLQEAIELKINRMLSQPEALDLSAVKDIKKALELIEDFKNRYEPEKPEGKNKSIDPETLKKIREEVYGFV
ncbi:MAG: hypothetical protein JRI34_12925 [Deltaproteobacteria bacterium]|nr:hypothetical protein [Deltaproteobacteria bacterium]